MTLSRRSLLGLLAATPVIAACAPSGGSSDSGSSSKAGRAALGITWHPTKGKRIYYARETGTDRVFVATESGGTWTSTSVAPGLPIDRLAVERDSTGTDVLYLADTANGRLYYGRN